VWNPQFRKTYECNASPPARRWCWTRSSGALQEIKLNALCRKQCTHMIGAGDTKFKLNLVSPDRRVFQREPHEL
jgi:hypothetical protein